jgi:ribosomal protein S18 acetylase RimI-like enzyme
MRIRRLAPPDRDALAALLHALGDTFRDDEIAVAMELVDAAIAHPGRDYEIDVCEDDAREIVAYICYGPTPMTDGTYDLYWIATHPRARGRGIASRLILSMEAELRARCARIVRLETSHMELYGSARSLYARLMYVEVGRIPDFYRQGDDLIVLSKRLDVVADASVPLPRAAVLGD